MRTTLTYPGGARSFAAFDQERLELIEEVKCMAKEWHQGWWFQVQHARFQGGCSPQAVNVCVDIPDHFSIEMYIFLRFLAGAFHAI